MKKNKSLLRKIATIAMSSFLIISLLPAAAFAEGEQSQISLVDYIKTKPISSELTSSWSINLPLSKALEDFAPLMESIAKTGAYPHGRDGKNKIAYIRYSVKFPKTVDVESVDVKNTCSFINGKGISYITTEEDENKVIKFKIPLNDVNWKGIYDSWKKDQEDPLNHTIDCTINYKVNNLHDLDKNILSSGDFAFYPSGFGAMLNIGLKEFPTDKCYVPIIGGSASTNSQPGEFSQRFNLDDLILEGSGSVVGEELTNKDDKSGYMLKADQDIYKIKATLHTEEVKKQLANIEENSSLKPSQIYLNKLENSFKAVFILPKEAEFVESEKPVLSGDNGFYQIKSVSYDKAESKLTVDMALKDAGKIKTLSDLAAAVNGMDNKLDIVWTLKTLNKDNNKDLSIDGEFISELKADAGTSLDFAEQYGIPFTLGWKSRA